MIEGSVPDALGVHGGGEARVPREAGRPDTSSEAERRGLMREGETFAETLRRASFGAEDLLPWAECTESDIEDARRRAGSRHARTRMIARRELVYKPVLLERLRAIARERTDRGRR